MLVEYNEDIKNVNPYKDELSKLGYRITESGIECDADISEYKWVGYKGMLKCFLTDLCMSALECRKILKDKHQFALIRVSSDKIVNLSCPTKEYSFSTEVEEKDKDSIHYSMVGLLYTCLPRILKDVEWKHLYFIYAGEKIIIPPYVWKKKLFSDVYNVGLCIEE